MKDFFELAGVGLGAFVLFVAIFFTVFAIGTAITSLIVAAVWNWFGVHDLFDAGTLSFWEVVGIAAALNFTSGILRPTVTVGK